MEYLFTTDGKPSKITTSINVKNSDGNYAIVDTLAAIGSRHVISAVKEGSDQVITLSTDPGVFTNPLVSDDGKRIKVFLDKEAGILNPYLTIDNWSYRETSASGSNIVMRAALYKGTLADLPDFLPFGAPANAIPVDKNPKTHTPKNSATGISNGSLTLSAAVAATLIGMSFNGSSKQKGSPNESSLIPNVSRPHYSSGGFLQSAIRERS